LRGEQAFADGVELVVEGAEIALPHDLDVDEDSTRAAQDTRQHGNALLGESESESESESA
jgi:hypothetical protein